MTRPYRKERVASLVHEIVSETVAGRLHDPRIAPLTTVTRVEVTPDLLIAKVYFSVLGDDAAERRTITAIRHAGGFIQRQVAQGLSLRQCPVLRFDIDESAKRARQTLALLDQNRREHPEWFADAAPADDATAPAAEQEDRNVPEQGTPQDDSEKVADR